MASAGLRSSGRVDADVAVIGCGISGAVLAAVLTRSGADVLLLGAPATSLPADESTTPQASMLARVIAERYDLPEIARLASFESLRAKVSPASGIKRNLGFLYHRWGERHDPEQWNELPLPGAESHIHRRDVDAWALSVAISRGARALPHLTVRHADVDERGVTLVTSGGGRWRTRYVVDTSGPASPLAAALSLREEPTRLGHHARTLFTHMVDVEPYERVVPRGTHATGAPWSQGSLHHLFEGGYLRVVPFGNHARAVNPAVSITLSLDPRVHPAPGCPPGEEFRRFVRDFPGIAPQFARARAVRPWQAGGRAQYSSRRTVGGRWCVLSRAAGFVDTLFSPELGAALETVNALGWRLAEALAEDDFAVCRFKPVAELEQGMLDAQDEAAANAHTAFRSYELWDAWFRVWSVGQRLSHFEIYRAYGKYLESRDPRVLEDHERQALHGPLAGYEPAGALFRAAGAQMRQVRAGRLPPHTAAGQLLDALRRADFLPPALAAEDPANRGMRVTGPAIAGMLHWAKSEAPSEVGRLVYEGLTYLLRRRFSPLDFGRNVREARTGSLVAAGAAGPGRAGLGAGRPESTPLHCGSA